MNVPSRSEAAPRVPGTERFGRYRLRGVLRQGGMGRLYLAEQAGIQGFTKIVALKRLLPHLADSPELRTMFLDEARVAARLEHPNIVATYELGEASGTYFIAMEYLPGEDLHDVLAICRGRPMPLEVAAAVAQQAGQGLHYAHELRDAAGRPFGVVHRDVNPSNVFLTYFGVVKLLDFGVVKAGSTPKTLPGVFKGSYAYCAPEQLQGRTVDRRTDVFSLGLVLWECLTGRRLLDGDDDLARIEALRTRPIPPPSALRPDVPPELDRIALTALQRDRERRFQTAGDLCDALERFLSRRARRPTSKSLGEWLEGLFGEERAFLKKTIAQGTDLESSLARLQELCESTPRPGSGPSARPHTVPLADEGVPLDEAEGITSPYDVPGALFEGESRPQMPGAAPAARRPLPRAALALLVPLALAGAGAAAWMVSRGGRSAVTVTAAALVPAPGALDLRSAPEGAAILVDGEPTGLTTPAVLSGLQPGRAVEIRLDRPGFAPVVARLVAAPGEARVHSFDLVPRTGLLRLEGLPPHATVYVDGHSADGTGALAVPLGARRLDVAVGGEVILSRTVEVQAGEQIVRLDPPGGRP